MLLSLMSFGSPSIAAEKLSTMRIIFRVRIGAVPTNPKYIVSRKSVFSFHCLVCPKKNAIAFDEAPVGGLGQRQYLYTGTSYRNLPFECNTSVQAQGIAM